MKRKLAVSAMALAGVLFAPLQASAQGSAATVPSAPLDGASQERRGSEGGSFGLRELTAADDFKGMKVQDRKKMEIGKVDRLILDPAEGRIAYVVVSAGRGGSEGGQVIVPWRAVQVQGMAPAGSSGGGGDRVLVLLVPREELLPAPGGGMRTVRDQGRQIHDHYGVSPYWEQGQVQPPGERKEIPSLPPGHQPMRPPGHSPFSPPRQP